MAQIGNLGKLIVFQVSSKKVLTFSRMQQTVRGRWTSHNSIKHKPVNEFLGPELRSVSMQIKLSTALGVKPMTILKKIESAVEKGKAYTLVIGGEKIGANQWIITDMSESWEVVYSEGELASCSLTLTLLEYTGG